MRKHSNPKLCRLTYLLTRVKSRDASASKNVCDKNTLFVSFGYKTVRWCRFLGHACAAFGNHWQIGQCWVDAVGDIQIACFMSWLKLYALFQSKSENWNCLPSILPGEINLWIVWSFLENGPDLCIHKCLWPMISYSGQTARGAQVVGNQCWSCV